MGLWPFLPLIALGFACVSPAPYSAGAQLIPREDVLAPHIQKEWQAIFYEEFKKDPKSMKAIGFFSSGGWSHEGQALFMDQGDKSNKSTRYLYAHSGLNTAKIEQMQSLQLPPSDLDLAKIESFFPLENIDTVSFDNLNWEIVVLKKETGFSGKSIQINSVYINTGELAKHPKHERLIHEIRKVQEKALEKLRGKSL